MLIEFIAEKNSEQQNLKKKLSYKFLEHFE